MEQKNNGEAMPRTAHDMLPGDGFGDESRPDHELARLELSAMAERLGLAFSALEHVPAREETPREERARAALRARGQYAGRAMDCDPTAGRVRFTLFARTPNTPGGPYSGRYSAGSLGLPSLGGSALRYLDFPKSADGHAATCRVARAWRPELVDVLGSMLSDVSGWEGAGPTFREWLEEGLAEEMNAADALECFEAISAEYRFLSRVFGGELQRACEIAGRF